MRSNRKIINRRSKDVAENDFYGTPRWATLALFNSGHLKIPGEGYVWEPACGCGHMSDVIDEMLPNAVWNTDLIDRGYQQETGFHQVATGDFLDSAERKRVAPPGELAAIITNPPFSLAAEFAKAGLTYRVPMALLCRLSWLEGQRRYDQLFALTPPNKVLLFIRRVAFIRNGVEKMATGVAAHAWMLWDADYAHKATTLHWLTGSENAERPTTTT